MNSKFNENIVKNNNIIIYNFVDNLDKVKNAVKEISNLYNITYYITNSNTVFEDNHVNIINNTNPFQYLDNQYNKNFDLENEYTANYINTYMLKTKVKNNFQDENELLKNILKIYNKYKISDIDFIVESLKKALLNYKEVNNNKDVKKLVKRIEKFKSLDNLIDIEKYRFEIRDILEDILYENNNIVCQDSQLLIDLAKHVNNNTYKYIEDFIRYFSNKDYKNITIIKKGVNILKFGRHEKKLYNSDFFIKQLCFSNNALTKESQLIILENLSDDFHPNLDLLIQYNIRFLVIADYNFKNKKLIKKCKNIFLRTNYFEDYEYYLKNTVGLNNKQLNLIKYMKKDEEIIL